MLYEEITLSQAALRLRLPWHAAHKLALRGELGRTRQVAGRWLISADDVESYLERKRNSDAPQY